MFAFYDLHLSFLHCHIQLESSGIRDLTPNDFMDALTAQTGRNCL